MIFFNGIFVRTESLSGQLVTITIYISSVVRETGGGRRQATVDVRVQYVHVSHAHTETACIAVFACYYFYLLKQQIT